MGEFLLSETSVVLCACETERVVVVDSLNVPQSADLFLPPSLSPASFDSIRDGNFQSKPSLTDLFPEGIALCTERRGNKRDIIDQLGGDK